jgi:hypothetical protein
MSGAYLAHLQRLVIEETDPSRHGLRGKGTPIVVPRGTRRLAVPGSLALISLVNRVTAPSCIYRPSVAHQSDSTAQREAEPLILAGLAKELGVELVPRSLLLDGGARVDIDGVADDESVFVEIFAHQGPLKGGQFHKVARDALKLITVARSRPAARLFIAFADTEAAAGVSGRSWLAEALRTWDVEVRTVDLDDQARDRLRGAQSRQIMVNPSADPIRPASPLDT